MTDLEKLEFIHHAIQEAMVYDDVDKHDYDLLQRSLSFVEDLREPHMVSRHCKNSLTMGDRDD